MSQEKDEIKQMIVDRLSVIYEVKTNVFVKGRSRDTILPICIMSQDDKPCLVIRLRLRDNQNSQKYSGKPIKRLKRWEEITGRQVITIWCREEAEKIVKLVQAALKA